MTNPLRGVDWGAVGRKVEGTEGGEGAGTGIVKLDKIGFCITKLN